MYLVLLASLHPFFKMVSATSLLAYIVMAFLSTLKICPDYYVEISLYYFIPMIIN